MRYLLALTFSISLLCSVSAQKKAINIPHLWESYSFYPKMVPGFNFMNDGKHYTVLENASIVQYDLTSGNKTNIIYSASDFNFSDYTFSKDEQKIVLEVNREQIYRRSSKANFFVWDRTRKH